MGPAGEQLGDWPKPKRDMVATDGQRLPLGDTTLTLYVTPGHTLGTISILITVKDGGTPHLVAEWGETGFNFAVTPERPRRSSFRQTWNQSSGFAISSAEPALMF